MTTVKIPPSLREFVDRGSEKVFVNGSTVRDIIARLVERYPGLARIRDDYGNLKSNVTVYLDKEEIQKDKGIDVRVRDGVVLSVVYPTT
jgi:molybdopterin converting factor small subunit